MDTNDADEKMKGLSPLTKLEQGYACVTKEQGKRVTSAGQIKKGDRLQLYLSDGCIEAIADKVVVEKEHIFTGKDVVKTEN